MFVYSYKLSESGSLVEYTGDLNVKSVKSFVIFTKIFKAGGLGPFRCQF